MLIYRIIDKIHESNFPKHFCSLCLSFRKYVLHFGRQIVGPLNKVKSAF